MFQALKNSDQQMIPTLESKNGGLVQNDLTPKDTNTFEGSDNDNHILIKRPASLLPVSLSQR